MNIKSIQIAISIIYVVCVQTAILGQNQATNKILTSKDFIENYEYVYKAVKDFKMSVLVSEFSDAVEAALISGSHLTRTSLKPKVRQFQNDIFNNLKKELCDMPGKAQNFDRGEFEDKYAHSLKKDSLKSIVVNCINKVSKEQNINLSNSDFGMIAGIAVQIIEKMSLKEFCKCEHFDKLDKKK